MLKEYILRMAIKRIDKKLHDIMDINSNLMDKKSHINKREVAQELASLFARRRALRKLLAK